MVWCHSYLKMPMQLPYSAVSWIWSRKLWNICIQIRLLCWQWTSQSPQKQKRYSGCGPTHLVTTNNYMIMMGGGGGGVFMLRWPGEWLNGSGWPSVITTAGTVLQNLLWKHLILPGQDMPTRLQLKRWIFCSRMPSFLMRSFSLIMQSAPVTNTGWRLNCSLNTGLLFSISSSVSFSLCVEFIVVTTSTIHEMSD